MRKKLFQILKYILFIPIVTLIGYNLYFFNAKNIGNNSFPTPFGYGMAVVTSGSMATEINVDDVIIAKKLNDLEVGDVIVFEVDNDLIIHRIVEMYKNDSKISKISESDMNQYLSEDLKDINYKIVTKGDANNANDNPINLKAVKGKYSFKIPKIGILVTFLRSVFGCVLLVLLLIIIFILSNRAQRKELQEKEKEILDEIMRLKNDNIEKNEKK